MVINEDELSFFLLIIKVLVIDWWWMVFQFQLFQLFFLSGIVLGAFQSLYM